MSKSEIIFSVHDLTSEIDNDSYHSFSCAIEINGLKEDEIICEHQLRLYNNDNDKKKPPSWDLIYTCEVESCMVSSNDNTIYLNGNFSIDGSYIPNGFKWLYRFSKETGSIKFSPKLPQKKGTSLLNIPPKNLIGSSKWSAGGVNINSLVIKNTTDGYFDCKYLTSCSKLDKRGTLFNFNNSVTEYKDNPKIFSNEFLKDNITIEASEKIEVNCKVFEILKWQEFCNGMSFKTEKVNNE